MDEQQLETKKADWNDFLDKIAKEIDGLVLKHPKVKEKFREQIRPFAERWKKHNREVAECDRKRLKHWERVKQNPAWQDKEAGPPKKGWEWDEDYLLIMDSEDSPIYEMPAKYGTELVTAIRKYLETNCRRIQEMGKEQTSIVSSSEYWNLQETIKRQILDIKEIQDQLDNLSSAQRNTSWIRTPPLLERRRTGSHERSYTRFWWWKRIGLAQEAVFGCYHRPAKEPIRNPVECLKPIKQDEHPISIEWDAERKLSELKNRADEYERYYVTLTSIHDNRLSVTSTRIADESIWPKELAEQLWFRFADAQPYGPNKTFIEQALEHVIHDLREVALLDNRKDILNVDSGGDTASKQAAEVGPVAGRDKGPKITKDEANVRARQLLKETPDWHWTCRKLNQLIPCPLAWIPYLPSWRAYHEKRQELRGNKTIDTVSLSRELELVLGEGEKDEVLNQLIAEQEGEEREDARRTKLYLSQQKKPERGGQ